ncbi:hypothetical protein I3760_15G161300 [Carya illinoinensis]|uniref:Uncharacterized protein n=1 Tax=Carya illinoinensis TaxID=32201 RepID=A0A8T1NGB7_CARIL|nr:hypothetical protein I3760_15G161300 [Carya illinoinensis]KAG6628134.1 hypothetical protein CIPAW_15G180300 [Carya illinoinensis]
MLAFKDILSDCVLMDLGFRGPKFTWSNKRDGRCISERLDRFLANYNWTQIFPQVVVTHGIATYSDHLPLWINTEGELVEGKKKPFRFEAMWVSEDKCTQIIEESWQS